MSKRAERADILLPGATLPAGTDVLVTLEPDVDGHLAKDDGLAAMVAFIDPMAARTVARVSVVARLRVEVQVERDVAGAHSSLWTVLIGRALLVAGEIARQLHAAHRLDVAALRRAGRSAGATVAVRWREAPSGAEAAP